MCNQLVYPKERSKQLRLNNSVTHRNEKKKAKLEILHVIKAPRLAGERKPRQAKTKHKKKRKKHL